MLKTIKFIAIQLSLIMYIASGFSQTTRSHALNLTLNRVSLMDVEPSNTSFTFAVNQPVEAGAPVQLLNDNSKWINYTSCVSTSDADRTISVKMSGTLPSGIGLQLLVAPYSGSGHGVLGTSVGTVTLTTTGKIILNGIRGCYTGNGTNNGHRLTYSLLINNYSSLSSGSYGPFVITYTISN